jgi:O-antigen/teichoic acid export membrane protein
MFLGATEVGYINWAGMVAAYAVFALMIFTRIYMPAFARMQNHPEQLGRFVERIIWATNSLAAPLSILILTLAVPITRLIYGEKWLAALPILYLLWVANLFVATVTPLYGLLNAIGKSRVTFVFTVIWMAGTWAIGVPSIIAFGSIGFAIANVIVQFSNLILFRTAQRYVKFRILPMVAPCWLIAGFTGAMVHFAQHVVPVGSIPLLFLYAVVGLGFYLAVFGIIYGERIRLLKGRMGSFA